MIQGYQNSVNIYVSFKVLTHFSYVEFIAKLPKNVTIFLNPYPSPYLAPTPLTDLHPPHIHGALYGPQAVSEGVP